jgi:uncharacterized membrane protein YqgA involved in biofilm formation
MIGTIVNSLAVLIGSFLGLVLHKRVNEKFQTVVYNGIGIITLVIGVSMALESQRVLYLALSVVIGGILGEWWNVEGGILRFGEFLKRRFTRGERDGEKDFAYGFLASSVLFCVGAMALVGSFKAGVEQDYDLLFTKSVMDGFMSILLAAAMGAGVAFSALSVFLYQGAFTLLSVWLQPVVTPLVLSELTGVGGALVLMIGMNLLQLKQIKTANFVPALVVVTTFVALEPLFSLIAL